MPSRERHARHQVDWIERPIGGCSSPGPTPCWPRSTPRSRSCAAALGWLLDHDEIELAGRLVGGLLDYGFLRLRPDVLAWAERVADADPDDRSPAGAAGAGRSAAYAAWMAGDVAESGVREPPAPGDRAEQAGRRRAGRGGHAVGNSTRCSRDGSTRPPRGTGGPPRRRR